MCDFSSSENNGKLLLLSKHFPFNQGQTPAESYLETEIVYLASSFTEVLVVATEAAGSFAPTCLLPPNVSAISLNLSMGKKAKLKLAGKGLFVPLFGAEKEKDAFAADSSRGIKARLFRGYYTKKATRKFDAISEVLSKTGFVPTHIYSFWFFDTALVASWLKQDFGAFCFSRAHRYDLYPDRNVLGCLPCRDYQLIWNDLVFPCSKDGVEYLSNSFPDWAKKIRLSYLGTKNIPDCSRSASINEFSIVSCSSLTPVKRVSLIVEALRQIDLGGTSIRWTHFGDGPEMSKIKEAVRTIPDIEVELFGNVSNAELLQHYSEMSVDLFVNVSSSEGLPISIMEACGFGFPVLATAVGGTSEIVHDGVNGVLLPEDLSEKALADEIRWFFDLSNANKLSMRQASRRIWEQSFKTSDNVEKLLNEVLSAGDNIFVGADS